MSQYKFYHNFINTRLKVEAPAWEYSTRHRPMLGICDTVFSLEYKTRVLDLATDLLGILDLARDLLSVLGLPSDVLVEFLVPVEFSFHIQDSQFCPPVFELWVFGFQLFKSPENEQGENYLRKSINKNGLNSLHHTVQSANKNCLNSLHHKVHKYCLNSLHHKVQSANKNRLNSLHHNVWLANKNRLNSLHHKVLSANKNRLNSLHHKGSREIVQLLIERIQILNPMQLCVRQHCERCRTQR